jgi:glutamate dehydrogenase
MPNHPDRESILQRVFAAVDDRSVGSSLEDAERARMFAKAVISQLRSIQILETTPSAVATEIDECWAFARAVDPMEPNVSVRAGAEGQLVVLSVMADQPFIVDTIRLGLRERGAMAIGGINVIVRMARGQGGARVVGEGEGRPESIVRFTAEGIDGEAAAELEADLRQRLAIARAAVQDFEAMMTRVENAALAAFDTGGEEGIEGAEFLRWCLSDNFVFLGVSSPSEQLGADRLAGTARWPAVEAGGGNGIISIRKGATEAPVHRSGRIDVIRVDAGAVHLVVRGMFTHRALTQPCRHLPILRRRLAAVLADTRQRPNSYRFRGLANMFDALPTEWLLSATATQVRDVLERMFDADQEQTAKVHVTQHDDGGTTFTLVALPETRYSDAVRGRILTYLGRLTGATYTDSGLFAGRFDSVLLQVYQTGTRALLPEDGEGLERFINDLTTPWIERISPALTARHGDDAGPLVARYADAFPQSYREQTSTEQSVEDIAWLEESRRRGIPMARVFEHHGELFLRVYETADIMLTELMPIIDNFGLLISDQWATTVKPRGLKAQDLDTFRVTAVAGLTRAEILARGDALVEGLGAVFQKKIASDAYNRLLLRAGLRWDEVDLVRAYIAYARQLGLRHPILRVQEILLNQAPLVSAIIRLFHAKFRPELDDGRAAAIGLCSAEVQDRLRQVKTADEDFVLRTLFNLVEASLRTNFYRTDRVCHYISFKVEHARIRNMPLPRMMVEIYVHHREVEGVHLRGGPIARGGLRFSDRADFRTEILGLVTTQMVKNVVIVPEGSKGGFYIKYTIDDAAERRRKGDELYQILIRGMLDVTDNYVSGKVVRPDRVVAHDGDDPYLVVAADKGTAHLSDTANRLSKAYGFWLGDAFASGGSNGYDHKKVGITARGAWVLVKRLFREMGADADQDEFTCFGIGDCGGDVFGNGVIETPKMKLLAAFNHAHVFLDPNPDPARTFVERRRLFDEVKGWDGYDRSLLSAGGGIWSRKDKTIPLSPEARGILGTSAEELSPDQVINLILKMPVDLFWNGGIGTYVRASHETNADANDPPNDDLRVSAADLRCKVVGEGGNLGFTQAARVEFALAGGRLNTDFVDNSGGVDTSDHEVNLKILLNPMVAAGRITEEERNAFLATMTDEVAAAVLDDNNANGRMISLDVVRSARDPFPYGRAIDWLCQKGNVTRRFLTLPSDDDLKRRAANRQGLVRPELAVVQAHVKMHLYKSLLQEDPKAIPDFDSLLVGYFPGPVRERYGPELSGHMLAKAIGMTVLLTQVCTDAGAAYFPMMLELTGSSVGRVAGAWLTAMRLCGGGAVKADLLAARARPDAAYAAWTMYTEALSGLVAHWLAPGNRGPEGEDPAAFSAALAALAASRTGDTAAAAKERVDGLVGRGIPPGLAERIVDALGAVAASEVCALADARKLGVREAAVLYQAAGRASRLMPAILRIATRRGEGRWDPVALGILRLRYQALLRDVAMRAGTDGLALGVERAAEKMAEGLKEVASVTDRIVGEAPDVASLLVGEQRIRAALA